MKEPATRPAIAIKRPATRPPMAMKRPAAMAVMEMAVTKAGTMGPVMTNRRTTTVTTIFTVAGMVTSI